MKASQSVLSKCKSDLVAIYNFSIDNVKPESLIKKALRFEDNQLIVKDHSDTQSRAKIYDLYNSRLHVIGGGKCVFRMASALDDLVKHANDSVRFSHGAISVPTGNEILAKHKTLDRIQVKTMFGAYNNLPDDSSIQATQYILDSITRACEQDTADKFDSIFLVLLSGGGSACLTSPRHISLKSKLDITQRLVQKGANITELNTVRRFYSNIKGGRLAKHILKCNANANILNLIISDVIGNSLEYIASGPTYIDETSSIDNHELEMRKILSRYNINMVDVPKQEIHDDMIKLNSQSIVHKIIGNNMTALESAKHMGERLGYNVLLLDGPLQGTNPEALKIILDESMNQPFKGKTLLIAGGETTVCRGDNETWGPGGRLQEMCLDYLLERLGTNDQPTDSLDFLLAGSTDGQDGPTDVAACMVSVAGWQSDDRLKDLDDCANAKIRHDSYNFWSSKRPDWLLKTGLTGTNVMDIYLYTKIQL